MKAKPRLPVNGEQDYEFCPRCQAPSRGDGGYWCDHPGVGHMGWKSTADLNKPIWQTTHHLQHRLIPIWIEYEAVHSPMTSDKKTIIHYPIEGPDGSNVYWWLQFRPALIEENGFFRGELLSTSKIKEGDQIAWVMYQSGKKILCSGPVLPDPEGLPVIYTDQKNCITI